MTESSSLLTTSPIEQETMTRVSVEPEHYLIRRLSWDDTSRQDAYQRLRADIFVKQLQWKIPLDEFGRERDRYDMQMSRFISSHCVYGVHKEGELEHEFLLGGVRIFQLASWEDSMVVQEFCQTKMIPQKALNALKKHYRVSQFLELTRFCVQRGRRYILQSQISAFQRPSFNLTFARDFTYAAVYQVAEKTQRYLALALVDENYLRVMERSHFVFDVIYARSFKRKLGYALTVIDLAATIDAIEVSKDANRAARMTILCKEKTWLSA